ncbi:hypothetical protein K7432_012555 [Basidiobolus ranarum]|uniref:U-box domain-containing protein n=1 Tax=Basidiobolus ranarum TaxID=34480 RepID=A0ABR2WKM9_9FUNG
MSNQNTINTAEREFEVLAKRFLETENVDLFEFPSDFVCAISHTLMEDPVMTSCGSVYERKEIEQWLVGLNKATNPEDNTVLKDKTLTPCLPVKRRIEAFKQAVRNLGPEAAVKLSKLTSDGIGERRMLISNPNEGSSSSSAAQHGFDPTPAADCKSKRKIDHYTATLNKDVIVKYDTLGQILTRSAARNAIMRDQTIPHIVAVLGTYLLRKRVNIQKRGRSVPVEYRFSSRHVAKYNHLIHKLEKLSRDVMSIRFPKALSKSIWVESLKGFRRELFIELCAHNNIVSAFSHGMAGGPMQLPELTANILLGKSFLRSFSAGRLSPNFRAPNLKVGLELLQQVHTVFLIDDSGSMLAPGHTSWRCNYNYGNNGAVYGASYSDYRYQTGAFQNQTRWQQVRSLLEGIATIVTEQDPQGIDIFFLNHRNIYTHVRSANRVRAIFDTVSPMGGTFTGQRINDILDAYMATLRYDPMLKPLNLIVFTDGEASDEPKLHAVIEEHVTRIIQRGYVAHQLGIEFVQVGDDWEATAHLQRLEEEVSRHHLSFQRDIIGVTPTPNISKMDSEIAVQILLSGIDARMNGYMRQRRINV